jgi:hypothetical protein
VRERSLVSLWRESEERVAAAAAARAANDRMLAKGGALAAFPFCPALALQRTGDALTPDADHVEQAEAAARVREAPA